MDNSGKLFNTVLFLISFMFYFFLVGLFIVLFYKHCSGDIKINSFPGFTISTTAMLSIMLIFCSIGSIKNYIDGSKTILSIMLIILLAYVVFEQFVLIGVSIHDFMEKAISLGKFISYMISYILNPVMLLIAINIVKGVFNNVKD